MDSSKKHKPDVGDLILSEPFMPDRNFKRAVIIICESNDEGSFGLILNKTLEMQFEDVVLDFPNFSTSLFYGGPVQPDTLHYLHNLGDKIEGSIEIAKGLYWGGEFEAIKELIDKGEATTDNFRFFLGYSGWGKGQLAEEMQEHSWIIAPAKASNLFEDKPDDLWKKVMSDMGGEFSIMANYPESPMLN